MNVLLIYLGYFYVVLGLLFLFLPLIYLEIGRPKDLIKAGLNLIIGMLLIFKYKIFDGLYSSILFVITILFIFYLVEIFTIRWNQLTNQEKNKLRTIVELKKNVSIFLALRNNIVFSFLHGRILCFPNLAGGKVVLLFFFAVKVR